MDTFSEDRINLDLVDDRQGDAEAPDAGPDAPPQGSVPPPPEPGSEFPSPCHEEGRGGNLSVLIACLLIVIGVWSSLSRTSGNRSMLIPGKRGERGVVAVIGVSGPIALSADSDPIGIMTSSGAEKIIYHLSQARADERVKAVVLRIDSPGGTVAAAQEICAEIDRLQASGKKIVASFADVAASGGYYIAAGCDKIFANPGTITGSIGVIMNGIEFSGLMEKAGVSDITVKSGRFKDMGSPYRKVSVEEVDLMSGIIEDVRKQFTELVMEKRGISAEKMAEIGDGRIMNGRQAFERGLVDTLGDLEAAIVCAGEISGLGRKPKVIHVKSSPLDAFFDRLGASVFNQGPGILGSGSYKTLKAVFSGAVPSLLMPGAWQTTGLQDLVPLSRPENQGDGSSPLPGPGR